MAAQGWLVLDLTDSPFMLGVVGACAAFPMLVFSLPAGVVADRISKRQILLVTQSLAMAQAFCLAALTHTGVVQVWHVMVLAAGLGTINALDMTTRHAMVIELASRKDALNAVSLNSTAFQTGRIVGPAVGGVLLAKVGVAGCFFVNGLTFLPLLVALTCIAPHPPQEVGAGPIHHHIREGVRWVRGQQVPRTLLLMLAVASLFAMPFGTLLPAFARDVFKAGPQAYGIMFSAPGVGAFIAAATMSARGHRWRLGRVATLGSLLFPVMLAAFSLAPSYPTALICLFLTGLGTMTFNLTANTMLQTAPPDELRGRIMSLRTFVFAGMIPFGSLQLGAVAQWLDPRWAVGIGAAVCMVSALIAWWRVPALRRSP